MIQTVNILVANETTQIITQRFSTTWPWYVIRGSGFVAAGLLVLLMLSGIGQVTGISYRFFEPVRAWAIHKAMAVTLVLVIMVHGGLLLIDKFLPFSLSQILVPFGSKYNNGIALGALSLGSFGVTFGILAMYLIVLIVASSLGWIDTKTGRWRKLHYLSYGVIFLVLLHALYVGSDLRYGMFREAWLAVIVIMGVAILARLWRAKVVRKPNRER